MRQPRQGSDCFTTINAAAIEAAAAFSCAQGLRLLLMMTSSGVLGFWSQARPVPSRLAVSFGMCCVIYGHMRRCGPLLEAR